MPRKKQKKDVRGDEFQFDENGEDIADFGHIYYWDYVQKSDGCWLWTGEHVKKYGIISVWTAGTRTRFRAPRVAYFMAYGPFDRKLNVLHHCDNPPCVNPNHLFLGTANDNVQDMIKKGRARLIVNTNTKMSDQQVEKIRQRRANNEMAKHIAKRYGICIDYVYRIAQEITRPSAQPPTA